MTDEAIKAYLSQIGARGGRAGKGAAKSRGSEHGRKAALLRWAKVKAAQGKKKPKG